MKIEFQVDRAGSILVAKDYLFFQLPILRRSKQIVLVISVLLAVVYASFNPATWSSHGEVRPIGSLILTILVQIPLISVVLFFIGKYIANSPVEKVEKSISDMSEDRFGLRKIRIEDGKFSLRKPEAYFEVSTSVISDIKETEIAFHLLQDGSLLCSIPKSPLDEGERQAIRTLNANQTEHSTPRG